MKKNYLHLLSTDVRMTSERFSRRNFWFLFWVRPMTCILRDQGEIFETLTHDCGLIFSIIQRFFSLCGLSWDIDVDITFNSKLLFWLKTQMIPKCVQSFVMQCFTRDDELVIKRRHLLSNNQVISSLHVYRVYKYERQKKREKSVNCD